MRHMLPALVLRALLALGIAGPARDQVADPDEVQELLEWPRAALSFRPKMTAMVARLLCEPLTNDGQGQPTAA